MKHNYTDNQIISFLYNECDLFEKLEIEFAMEEDSTLLETYEDLNKGKSVLPKVLFSPKKTSIDAILAYSLSIPA